MDSGASDVVVGKGNRVENWDADYAPLKTTYTERPDTVGDLTNLVRHGMVREDIERYLPVGEHSKILEVGCGGARTSVYLARRGYSVTCTDFAPEALRLARSNFEAAGVNGEIVQDDLLDSKLADGSFDCVMSFGLLEHFDELDKLAAALTRLVRPSGIQLHVVIPRKWSTQSLMDAVWFPGRFVRDALRGRWERIVERSYREFPHYENPAPASEYDAAFRKAGNEVIRREAAGTLYPFLALPGPFGRALVRAAPRVLGAAIRRVDRSEAPAAQLLAPGFYLILRRSGGS